MHLFQYPMLQYNWRLPAKMHEQAWDTHPFGVSVSLFCILSCKLYVALSTRLVAALQQSS